MSNTTEAVLIEADKSAWPLLPGERTWGASCRGTGSTWSVPWRRMVGWAGTSSRAT